MKLQHHEKRFIDSLEREFDTVIPNEDKEMLIKIWRRHGGNVKSFQVAKNGDSLDDPDLCNVKTIYIQGGKFHNAETGFDDVDYSEQFIAIVPTHRETDVGAPIRNVYVF